MIYRCRFPFCEYKTHIRNKIDVHHIIPKEFDGSDKKHNLINLCPTHHRLIYIPNTKGNHSIQSENSITILNIIKSTHGDILHYIKNGIEYGYIYNKNEEFIW